MRNRLLIILAALATLAVSGMTAAATTANADTVYHFFETYGSGIYITTDGTGLYAEVETGNGPGRDFNIIDMHDSIPDIPGYCTNSAPCEIYQIRTLLGHCVATNDAYTVIELRDCSSSPGYAYSNWALVGTSFNNAQWIATKASLDLIDTNLLSGANQTGLPLYICSPGNNCPTGTYSRWSVN